MSIKRIFLLLAACSIGTLSTQAQGTTTPKGNKVRFGAYVAPNMSWMKATASKDDKGEFNVERGDSKIGFNWGVMVDYIFADNYAITTGLQLNSTGGNIKTTRIANDIAPDVVNSTDMDYKLQYLEIPVQLKLLTDPVNDFRFFGQLGVTPAFNIQKKVTYTVNYLDENAIAKTATGENEKLKGATTIAPINFQMNIGVGAEYPISPKMKAYVGLFYNNGFVPDVTNPGKYKLNYNGTFRDGVVRVNSFALRLGLWF